MRGVQEDARFLSHHHTRGGRCGNANRNCYYSLTVVGNAAREDVREAVAAIEGQLDANGSRVDRRLARRRVWSRVKTTGKVKSVAGCACALIFDVTRHENAVVLRRPTGVRSNRPVSDGSP